MESTVAAKSTSAKDLSQENSQLRGYLRTLNQDVTRIITKVGVVDPRAPKYSSFTNRPLSTRVRTLTEEIKNFEILIQTRQNELGNLERRLGQVSAEKYILELEHNIESIKNRIAELTAENTELRGIRVARERNLDNIIKNGGEMKAQASNELQALHKETRLTNTKTQDLSQRITALEADTQACDEKALKTMNQLELLERTCRSLNITDEQESLNKRYNDKKRQLTMKKESVNLLRKRNNVQAQNHKKIIDGLVARNKQLEVTTSETTARIEVARKLTSDMMEHADLQRNSKVVSLEEPVFLTNPIPKFTIEDMKSEPTPPPTGAQPRVKSKGTYASHEFSYL